MREKSPAEKAYVLKKYGQRKKCVGCGKTRSTVTAFRLLNRKALKSGRAYLQGMCVSCERAYEAARWHTRTAASKAEAGGSALRRRRSAAASTKPKPKAKAA